MKKFRVEQIVPATITYIFEVEAENQTEALNKVIDGEVDVEDMETNLDDETLSDFSVIEI